MIDLLEVFRGTQAEQFVRHEVNHTDDTGLCERCRKINFHAIYNLDPGKLDNDGVPVSDLYVNTKMLNSECPTCCAFASMFSLRMQILTTGNIPDRTLVCHLRAFPIQNLHQMPHMIDGPILNSHVALLVCRGFGWMKNTSKPRDLLECGIIASCRMRPSYQLSNDISGQPSRCLSGFDARTVRAALTECGQTHVRCNAQTLDKPVCARVIDCISRKIIPLNLSIPYLALSYVWGSQAPSSPVEYDCNLPKALPQTIEDAISVTLSLGYRHLWVDRYCVNQYHAHDKQNQIENMANIYSWAFATICALGPNDEAGIHGVSLPRQYKHVARIQDLQITWLARHIKDFLKTSPWITRGWTLQEFVLSKRCLFFTEEEVVMICPSGVSREHSPRSTYHPMFDDENSKDSILSYGQTLDQVQSDQKMKPKRRQIFLSLRKEYSQRKLGHDADALNAFSSILTWLEVPSFWGTPVFTERADHSDPHFELAFLIELLWVNEAFESRRGTNFLPSWTALSQTGRIDIYSKLPPFSPSNVPFAARLHLKGPTSKLMQLGEFLKIPKSMPTHLNIQSVTGHWEAKKSADGTTYHSMSRTSDTRLSTAFALSSAVVVLDEPHPNAQSSRPAPSPHSGLCVLLLLHRDVSHPSSGSETVNPVPSFTGFWLAITPLKDGTFRRQGIVVWPKYLLNRSFDVDAVDSFCLAPENGLRTVRLG